MISVANTVYSHPQRRFSEEIRLSALQHLAAKPVNGCYSNIHKPKQQMYACMECFGSFKV